MDPPSAFHHFSPPTLTPSPCRQQKSLLAFRYLEVSTAAARNDQEPTSRTWGLDFHHQAQSPSALFCTPPLAHSPSFVFFKKKGLVTLWLFNFPLLLNCVFPGKEGSREGRGQ